MDFIPVIDLAKINEVSINANSKEWNETAQRIREGLGGIGFIYLKNHGVDKFVVTKAFEEAKKFFDLSQETKVKYKAGPLNGNYHNITGYTEPSQELLHPTSIQELRESFDSVNGYGTYPDADVPEFKSSINELRKQCNVLAKRILILMAVSLDLEDYQYFLNRCRNLDDYSLPQSSNIRSLHYSPIPEELEILPGTVRLGEHSDYGLLTFLFQDMIGGLEVQNVDGKWIPATPIADTIIVNTGDLLELWSSGIFPATKHRVMIPEADEVKRLERYSIVYFIGTDADTVVSSLKVERTESEEKRLSSRPYINYDEIQPVSGIEHIVRMLEKTYTTS